MFARRATDRARVRRNPSHGCEQKCLSATVLDHIELFGGDENRAARQSVDVLRRNAQASKERQMKSKYASTI